MNSTINYFLEANVLLLVLGVVYYGLVDKQSDFSFRRFFILTGATAVLFIPLVSIPIAPAILSGSLVSTDLQALMLPELTVGKSAELTVKTISSSWSVSLYIGLGYGLACIGFLLRFLLQLLSIRKLVSSSSAVKSKISSGILVETNNKYQSFSFFRYLILGNSNDISEKEKSQIIAHEQVHIRQMHSLDVVLLELMRALFWINPVIWFFRKSQADNHEFIVDDMLIKEYDKSQYQELLVKMTVGQMQYVGNYFAKIQTLKRIHMMNEKRKKPNKMRTSLALMSALLVVAIVACTEMVDLTKTAEMTLEIPEAMQADMDKLKEEYPDINFVYTEVNLPQIDVSQLESEEHAKEERFEALEYALSKMDGTVQVAKLLPNSDKSGVIMAPSAEFKRMAEYSKSDDGVYSIVDERPEPADGLEAFYGYIMQNMTYPVQARKKGVQGRVFVEFIVDEQGNINAVKALKGIGSGCDEEAIRVIKEAAQWKAGKLDGKPVKVKMVLPISFMLSGDDDETPEQKEAKQKELKEADGMAETVVVGHKPE